MAVGEPTLLSAEEDAEVVIERKRSSGKTPDRTPVPDEPLVGEGVRLEPFACDLGTAGQRAKRIGEQARGVWLGTVEAPMAAGTNSVDAAAATVAALLEGLVGLDCCGLQAPCAPDATALRFLRAADDDEEPALSSHAAAEPLGLATLGRLPKAYRLGARAGQILSHAADLWLAPDDSGSHRALLRLRPTPHAGSVRGKEFCVVERGPLGPQPARWEEVAMVELPYLLRIMLGRDAEQQALSAPRDGFLVDEEEEHVVIHAWRRLPPCQGTTSELPVNGAAVEEILGEVEQLLWYDTLAALAETPPCAEAPAPAARLRLVDEGRGSRDEVLAIGLDERREEDAPRLASLAFLRQIVSMAALEADALPRLFPGSAASQVRVLSASLAAPEPKRAAPPVAALPKSVDDLFRDDMDFRMRVPGADAAGGESQEDPLALHELTSVFLLAERPGFLLAFHHLQGIDPCATLTE